MLRSSHLPLFLACKRRHNGYCRTGAAKQSTQNAHQIEEFSNGDSVLSPKDIVRFPVTALLEDADIPSRTSSIDVAPDKFRFLKLIEYLQNDEIDMATPRDGTQISWRLTADVMIIGNDMELQDAIEIQQQHFKWEIDIFVRVLD
jgi:hypothetical protein